MQLSTKGRYSLEAMLFLASSPEAKNGTEIHQATGIPFGYLEQLMIPLKRAGLVASTRGARGGYTLARKGITCGEVISASEGGLKIPCRKCKRNEECLTESFWHEMETLLSRIADSITMERLASDLALMVKGMGI